MRSFIVSGIIILIGFLVVVSLIIVVSMGAQWEAVEDHFADGQIQQESRIVSGCASPTRGLTVEDDLPLRFAIAPVISPEDSYTSYKHLVDFVASALGKEGQIITRSSYGEINELVRDGGCDVAFVCTYSFVKAKKEFNARLLAIPVVDNKQSYQSYVIVRKGSPVEDIESLRGKTFGFADEISTSGWLYLAVLLKRRGHDPMSFFSKRVQTGSHDSSIFAVVDKQLYCSAVDSIVFDHMRSETREKLKVIHRSPEFGMPPFITPDGLDEELRKKILNALLSLHEHQRGREILRELKIDRFQVAHDSMYQSVEDMARIWESR